MSIDIRNKLKELEGESFFTVTGKEFVYEFISENAIRVNRTNYAITVSDFEKALEVHPTMPSQIANVVRGPSYIFAIITDNRFIT